MGEVGGPDVDVPVEHWPSDHRAVASTFEVEPGPAPRLVSASPRVARAGQTLTIRYTTTRGSGRRIGILPAHGGRPIVTLPIEDATDHLAAYFGTGGAGARARTVPPCWTSAAASGPRSPFWVLPRGARPRITATKGSFGRG